MSDVDMTDPVEEKRTLENKKVTERFWSLTSRHIKEARLVTQDFHKWGKLNEMTKKSITLHSLIESGVTERMDHKYFFEAILNEMELYYKILPLKSSRKMMVYDIASTPRWSFVGLGPSEREATSNAAKRGIHFFISLVK